MRHQRPVLPYSAFSVAIKAQGHPVPESEAGHLALVPGCIFQLVAKVPPAWQVAGLQGAGRLAVFIPWLRRLIRSLRTRGLMRKQILSTADDGVPSKPTRS